MSRRARTRSQHPRRAGPVVANAIERAINAARRLSDEDVAMQHNIISTAVTQFAQGQHCPTHWLSLADTTNLAETLARMGLGAGPDAERVINDAQRALADVRARFDARGSWTLYADEIDALRWLVSLHRTQLAATSYGEFARAMATTAQRVQQARAGNAPRGAVVVVGMLDSPTAMAQAAGGAA